MLAADMSMTASCDFFGTYCLSASSKEKSQETHIHVPTRFTCEEFSALLGKRVHGSREPRASKPSCLSSSNETCFAHIRDFQLSKTLSCPHLLLGISSAASLFLLTTKRSPEKTRERVRSAILANRVHGSREPRTSKPYVLSSYTP